MNLYLKTENVNSLLNVKVILLNEIDIFKEIEERLKKIKIEKDERKINLDILLRIVYLL